MKSIYIIVVAACLSFSCNKESCDTSLPLREQALPCIKNAISGNWQLVYRDGGFNNDSAFYHSTFIEFNFEGSGKIKWYNDTMVYSDGLLSFEKATFYSGNTRYLMHFPYLNSSLDSWYADKIENDTLYIRESEYDGFTYYLTKIE